jgi:hypothetical protein
MTLIQKGNNMMHLEDILAEVEMQVEALIHDTETVDAQVAGLDMRCGDLQIGFDFIAVPNVRDRMLQYYGGFEYVSQRHRHVLGNWVFYTTDSDRVRDHHEQADEFLELHNARREVAAVTQALRDIGA